MVLAMSQGLVMRFAMAIIMIALLQKHIIVVSEHISTSYLGEQEKLAPFSGQTEPPIVLPNGNSTSASLTNQKESLSLSKSKYDSTHKESSPGITSYHTVLTSSHVDWVDEKKLYMNQSTAQDANDRSDARNNNPDIRPFQGEPVFVIASAGQAYYKTSYDDATKGDADDYGILDMHVRDPNFQPNPTNTVLVIPLLKNSEFELLSVLCDESGTEAGNDANSGKDKASTQYYSALPHGVKSGDDVDGDEALATDMNHKIKGRFRLTFYLLDFSWSDVSGAHKKDQVEKFEENDDGTIWIASCPKNIICMGKQKQQELPSLLSASTPKASDSPLLSSTQTPINTDYEESYDQNVSIDESETMSSTMPNDFITTSPPATIITPKRKVEAKQLVKISKTHAFSPAYGCHKIKRVSGESRLESVGNESTNNATTLLLTIDIFPAMKAWLTKHADCPLDFSHSFVFSLKINEIGDVEDVDVPPHSHNVLQTPPAFETSALLHPAGSEHATFSMEYTIDARCAVPTKEACPVGKCSSDDYIFKFRSECSPARTGQKNHNILFMYVLRWSSLEQS